MRYIFATIATLTLLALAFTQSAEAFNPTSPDNDNAIVEILPWMPHYEGEKGDAGIYRLNERYVGLTIAAVKDASRPVTLYVEMADDSIIALDCKVTPYKAYLSQYRYSIIGIPAIVEINPEFWDIDFSQVRDTYFLSEEFGKERIRDVEFIPDASNEHTLRMFVRSHENGWKHWPQVVTDYLGFIDLDSSGF